MLRATLLASCAAAVLCAAVPARGAAPATPAQTYWYDGETKVPLYRQPQLRALANRRAAPPGAARIATRQNLPPIYEHSSRGKDTDPSSLPVYSTKADWRGAKLMVQAPGVVFTVVDDAGAKRAETWLAARGLHATPIADGAAYRVEGIAGEKALDLANSLYERKLVRYAQPNWVVDIDRQ